MDKKPAWFKKIFVVGIIYLFIGIGIQPAFGQISNSYSIEDNLQETDQLEFKNPVLENKSDLAYNIDLSCHPELFVIDYILAVLMWLPVDYLELRIENDNDEKIRYKLHYKITTFNGRVIYDFNRSNTVYAGQTIVSRFMRRLHLFREMYTFGPFQITVELFVKNDNSTKTVLFRGFLFFIGATIFNNLGDIIP